MPFLGGHFEQLDYFPDKSNPVKDKTGTFVPDSMPQA
jgi:hypothetical protein